jgi:hypothetical protein
MMPRKRNHCAITNEDERKASLLIEKHPPGFLARDRRASCVCSLSSSCASPGSLYLLTQPHPTCPPTTTNTVQDSRNASKKRQRAVQAASKEGKCDDHSVKAMMVVRRLSVGVRGSFWYRQAQGQQLIRVGAVQGGRRLSSSTFQESNNQKEAVSLPTYWGQQWQKVKESGPVLLVFLTAGAAIWEGSRQVEKLRNESSMKEEKLRNESSMQMEKLRGEMKELRGEMKEKEEKLRGEVKEKEALLRGEFNKEDALRGGEMDRRVLDFLTRGDSGRTRELVEEQKKAWVAGLSPPPPPPPST